MTARITAPLLSKRWGVPVNVINKPGGNTIPAQVEIYSSPADGYTIYTDGQPTSTLVAVKEVPFKIMDRTFIASTLAIPNILVVPMNSPIKHS
jgi:tripartite-type tricarboxylate transporter receptor subunit TctC